MVNSAACCDVNYDPAANQRSAGTCSCQEDAQRREGHAGVGKKRTRCKHEEQGKECSKHEEQGKECEISADMLGGSWRQNAAAQGRDRRLVRACAVEMHMDISQEQFDAKI